MNILLTTSIFNFLVIFLPYWFMPYVTPKSIQFGVRIPREFEGDPVISDIQRNFHQILLIGSILIFALLVVLPAYLGLYFLSLFSMVLEVLFAYLVYFRSFRRLHNIKEQRGWYRNRTIAAGAVYDTEQSFKKTVPGFIFIIPAVAVLVFTFYVGISIYPSLPSLIPTHFGANGTPNQYSVKSFGSVFLVPMIQVGMTAGMFLIGYAISRTRQEIDVSRPTVTHEQQERFRWYTRDSLYLFASTINLGMMFGSFGTWQLISSSYILPFVLLPTLAGTSVLILVLMSFGQMGSRLDVPGAQTENTGLTNRSDDKDWKGGVINYDKNSSSILVAKRFGVGWTFNFARPASWLILGLLVALPIIIVVVIHLIR